MPGLIRIFFWIYKSGDQIRFFLFFFIKQVPVPPLAAVRPPVILLKVYKLLKVIGAENELSTRELLVIDMDPCVSLRLS